MVDFIDKAVVVARGLCGNCGNKGEITNPDWECYKHKQNLGLDVNGDEPPTRIICPTCKGTKRIEMEWGIADIANRLQKFHDLDLKTKVERAIQGGIRGGMEELSREIKKWATNHITQISEAAVQSAVDHIVERIGESSRRLNILERRIFETTKPKPKKPKKTGRIPKRARRKGFR